MYSTIRQQQETPGKDGYGEVILERREKNSLVLGMNRHVSGAHAWAVHVWTDPKEHSKGFETELTLDIMPLSRQTLQSELNQANCLLKQSQHSTKHVNMTQNFET